MVDIMVDMVHPVQLPHADEKVVSLWVVFSAV
jgi:hypothetical protein